VDGQRSASGEFEPWRVQLLGPLNVEKGGESAAFRTRKTAALLAYLVYYRGRSISKEQLIDSLWPESDADKGRQSLRMAVSSIRSTLTREGWDPLQHIRSDRDTLSASEEGFVSDVQEFRGHLQAAQASKDPLCELNKAVALYSGSFLAGISDDWILPHALELEEAYAQAVCSVIELTALAGEIQAAASLGRKAIAMCPSREDLHVALITAYGVAGQTGSAVQQYEELERMLDDMWGEMPGEEARAALAALPRREQGSVAVVRAPTSSGATGSPERTPFFGRVRELEELQSLLQPRGDGQRFVTLFGLGGTGKTRLAQQLADDMHDAFGGKVWFVSLVGADEAAQVHERLFSAIVNGQPKNTDILDAVGGAIGRVPALLVFDNLEHVVPAARATAEFLVAACPGLRLLATSRVPLDSPGERLVPLAPLPLPSNFRDLAVLRESPSVQLLVEAAQAVRPGFSVTTANAQSVLLLCRRLDGIPLAIELAAAKLATLSPAQVLGSLATSVDLTTDRASVPLRHRSLETVLQWSLGLLTQEERDAFACLSICRGGFNSELAADLLGPRSDEHLRRLCHCALLAWHEEAEEVRFEMLETVREMAAQLLDQDPVTRRGAIERHFSYVHRLCTSFHGRTSEAEKVRWVARMSVDTGNVLSAIETAAHGYIDSEQAWEMALQLDPYLRRRGRSQVWIGPLEGLLEATRLDLCPKTAARAHTLLAEAHYGLRAIRNTFDHCREAVEAADRSGDVILQIDARVELATPSITLGEFAEAERVLQAAIELLPPDDPKLAARCYLNLAWVLFDRGDEEDSESVFREALQLAEKSGDTSTVGSALTGLAASIGHSRYEESLLLYDRAVGVWTSLGLPGYLAHCLYNRSLSDYRHGRLDESLANISKAFRIYVGNDIALGQTILTIAGNLMAALGRHEEAAACWGRAEAARQRYGMLMIPTVARDFDHEIVRVRGVVPPAELQGAFDRFRGVSDEELSELLFGSDGRPIAGP
jgi:predicted ATPase/DNA-binding SARP family transcriptional activator